MLAVIQNSVSAAPPIYLDGPPEIAKGRAVVAGTLLMNDIFQVGYFLRTLKLKARYGEWSRAPLRLIRFEVRGEIAECDWMARPSDLWDKQLQREVRARNEATQALEDAIAIRDLIFSLLPAVNVASIRAFRDVAEAGPEMIIRGTVTRDQAPSRSLPSLVMRAKLCGLQFVIEDGALLPAESEACAMNF